ncbi:MAG TPA: ferritin-like domain-containing protein [Thermomicrobiales bacterium]|nr:ferritin-like domain-containing protein [Thermomicrobiales bacterium]
MSQTLANRFLSLASIERDRISSRRTMVGRTALVGGAAALAVAGLPAIRAAAQDELEADPFFEDDGIAILNYALTLEHLEATLYREALSTFTADDFTATVYDLLTQVGEHEAAHVDALTATITDLGGTPVEEATYDFGYTDAASFLATAAAIENVGVAAYAGAAPSVAALAPSLVPTALGIHSVEARHASFLAALINDADNNPFPNAVDAPLTPEEVLEIAGPFIVS